MSASKKLAMFAIACMLAIWAASIPALAQNTDESDDDFIDDDSTTSITVIDNSEDNDQFCAPVVNQYNNVVQGGANVLAGGDAVAAVANEANVSNETVINCINGDGNGSGTGSTDDDSSDDSGTGDDGTADDGTGDDGDDSSGNSELEEEQQDAEPGPLAGGTARGLDVLVPGDQLCGSENQFNCIDQVVIETESCEIVEDETVSVTLEDPGGLIRLRDGVNVDFELESDGTLRADGRSTVAGQDNPRRVITPIPVDPENYDFDDDIPRDTFRIASSTGVGGEGCKAVLSAQSSSRDADNDNETTTATNTGVQSSVIDGTYDKDAVLANTGGETTGLLQAASPSALIPAGTLLMVVSMGLGVLLTGRSTRRG